jgi:hypothetical protein
MSTPATSRRSYIALSAFNNDLYKYTVTLNPQTLQEISTLALNPQANASNCPAQRVLHENGRRINPPEGNYPGINTNVVTYMVGVYDPVTGLNGFINPNSATFAIFNTDKPNYLSAGADPTTGLGNLGNPVLTRGDVQAGGDMDVSGNALFHSNLGVIENVDVSGAIVGHQQIRSNVNTLYDLSGADITVDVSLGHLATVTVTNDDSTINFGNYFDLRGAMITLLLVNGSPSMKTISFGNGVQTSNVRNNRLILDLNAKYSVTFVCDGDGMYETARTASYLNSNAIGNIVAMGNSNMGDVNAVVVGSTFKKLYVSAQGCLPSSRVFFTLSGQNGPGFLSAEEITNNSFRIVSSNIADLCTVHWMVVNNVYGQ